LNTGGRLRLKKLDKNHFKVFFSDSGSGGGSSPFFRPENIVHHTIPTSSNKAPSASSKISPMLFLHVFKPTSAQLHATFFSILIVGMLAACGTPPPASPQSEQGQPPRTLPAPSMQDDPAPSDAPIVRGKSRWQPVSWDQLPGFEQDALHEAWSAWLRSCERAAPPWAALCPDIRRLSIADGAQQRAWMRARLQPYRVEPLSGTSEGLLTGYYEPVLEASRRASASQRVALWQPPAGLAQRKPWFTRQEIDTLPEARAALRGREIAYVADPVDALILQIQGSGKLRITEPDGSQKMIRLAFAGTNEQPYRSVGRWLLDQGLIRDASWPGIKAWIAANPARVQEMLWSNPRMVFFKEEALDTASSAQGLRGAATDGPRGAQGASLTAGRSIAVDRESIPLGAPVWLQTSGAALNAQRLVIAQDVGGAILGAVRADYYVGSGDAAGEVAGRLKQGLRLWVLWPKP
jgi:membrane-bound lytic murein transglycosylase A